MGPGPGQRPLCCADVHCQAGHSCLALAPGFRLAAPGPGQKSHCQWRCAGAGAVEQVVLAVRILQLGGGAGESPLDIRAGQRAYGQPKPGYGMAIINAINQTGISHFKLKPKCLCGAGDHEAA